MDGGDALWRTLPVARWQLFTAKILGLAVFFGLLPILLRLPWWLGHGFDARETGLAAIETAQTSAAVVALALALASVTSTAEQFYRWTLGAVGVAVVAALSLLLTQTGRFVATGDLLDRSLLWRSLATAAAVPLTLAAIGQFFAPNRRRTALLVALFITAGIFFGIFPVAPYDPRVKAELSAAAATLNSLTGNMTIAKKSDGSQAFITLKDASIAMGKTPWGGVFVGSEITALIEAAGYFSRSPGGPGPAMTYGFYRERGKEMTEVGEATLRAKGALWEPEYILSVPLTEGAEVVKGSRRLRIGHLIVGRADGATPREVRGQLVLEERQPAFAADEKYRPKFLSEFYVLVTPSGWKRIMSDIGGDFVSANVRAGTDILPLSEGDFGKLPDGSPAPASSVRVVKVGLRRLGFFEEKVPVTVGAAKP
ncbi:MAG TPA: hypothetical protein VG936_08680 [Lacunisphaera sp.]|nr:hypothetical protein [Lacunisphaera sp.]